MNRGPIAARATVSGRGMRRPLASGALRRGMPALQLGGRSVWLVLTAALVVLAATVVAWALSRAADRVAVVGVGRPISVGEVFAADDLEIRQVAVDGGAVGLVPAASMGSLVGRRAALDLEAGMLVSAGMWADEGGLGAQERSVGVVVRAGRFPGGLAPQHDALVIDLATDGAPIPVRVLDIETSMQRDIAVTLAVPAEMAAVIARSAAADAIAVIGTPGGAASPSPGGGPGEPTGAQPSGSRP